MQGKKYHHSHQEWDQLIQEFNERTGLLKKYS